MATRKPAGPSVPLTHLDKVFFPRGRFTKGDMIRYYVDVAHALLPHLKSRPVTLIRFPDGVDGPKFYEKNAPKFTPAWVKTYRVPRRHEEGDINFILVNNLNTLAWCANIGAIEFHPYLHKAPKNEQPTCVAFDLDPGEGAGLRECAQVALLIREILEALGLRVFSKVSGSKGIQLYVPLNKKATYAATGAFAKAVAEFLGQRHPELVVSNMAKARRKGRVLIDWSQNSGSKTTVAVYSLRGKRNAPFVSMPVTWDELQRCVRTGKSAHMLFSPEAAVARLRKVGDLFAPVLELKQTLPKAFEGIAAPTEAPLERYRAKRDFTKTREPAPCEPKRGKKVTRRGFVIQKHAASHLHYDFRLEMNGTLKSWAVPKGIPTALGVKHAAFAVEDHPLSYMKFEGTIPKGQYGGGTVMVWDIGTYELIGGSVEEGNLKLLLHGKKLDGEWHMFKIRSERGKDVWLVAKSHEAAKAIGARREDMSALSHRSMARIARDNDAQWSTAAG